MTEYIFKLTDEHERRLQAWEAENQHDPKFQALMEQSDRAYEAMLRLVGRFR